MEWESGCIDGEANQCPQCGAPEDVTHINKCRGKNADNVWDTALKGLQAWMYEQHTDPVIILAVLQGLNGWHYPSTVGGPSLQASKLAFDQQMDLGWHLMLGGWISLEWATLQQEHYSTLQSRKSGILWASGFI